MTEREGADWRPRRSLARNRLGMTKTLAPISQTSLARFGFDRLPRVITDAGDRACRRFVEFFTANIRRAPGFHTGANFVPWM